MKGYKRIPLSFGRQMVAVSASVTKEKNAIHSITEVDISEPRKLIKQHFEKTGTKLSFTSYIVCCLAKTITLYPDFNSFIKGNQLVILDDLTISVLIEREINGEKVPEPIGINEAQKKTLIDIQKEIRNAQEIKSNKIGSLSNYSWIRFIPKFLLKLFIRIAEKNINLAKKYGKVCVTAVGMFSKETVWFVPHGSATVLLTVGSINQKVVKIENEFVEREYLCLTVSFDHNIIDGAPAARFMNDLIKIIKSGDLIRELN
ncbi:MAG: 2-oxo acid dehydrogenase subunit E2 [Bacteroidetes bacterium]|nr:2-oxo acid dehydrogenase subunit E2 [Bacteroidota bacterium]